MSALITQLASNNSVKFITPCNLTSPRQRSVSQVLTGIICSCFLTQKLRTVCHTHADSHSKNVVIHSNTRFPWAVSGMNKNGYLLMMSTFIACFLNLNVQRKYISISVLLDFNHTRLAQLYYQQSWTLKYYLPRHCKNLPFQWVHIWSKQVFS